MMEFFVVSVRETERGSVLVTDKNLRLICSEKIPARSLVEASISEFWVYKGLTYARADRVVVKKPGEEVVR